MEYTITQTMADQTTTPNTAVTHAGKLPNLARIMPWLLVIGGVIGLICSFVIMFEKLELLLDPQYSPSCDLNPIISCGSVMASDQANAFGFPNPIIGLVAFPVLITLGVLLFTGTQFKRWLWWGTWAGTLFGVGFVHWLFYQSVYVINALCPYCMAVWAVTITLFWYVTLYNLRISAARLNGFAQRIALFAQRHHLDILVLWLLVITGLILKHFWYYFGASF